MKRAVLGVLVLAVCGMMIAPAAMAGKPGGGGNGSKYSTMTKDFVATQSIGRWEWGNARWFVMFWFASNQLPPGGLIKLYNVPNIVIPGYNDGPTDQPITYIQEDYHGEELTLPVSLPKLAVGSYDTKTIGNIGLTFYLYDYCVANNKKVDIHIALMSNLFTASDQYVHIDVTKNQIHIYSNTPLPFEYRNWASSDAHLLGSGVQSFDITIDK